jgi:mannose-1-phosphate guanylyltransferase
MRARAPGRHALDAPAALILAGGDGSRLRPLTRALAGDARPKQFCPILGSETLLDRTRRRAELVVAPDRIVTLLTRTHEPFYRSLAAAPGSRLVQPENRGTAPAILYGLLALSAVAPQAPLALLPSDHWVSDDAAFMAWVEVALGVVAGRPDLIVLLGIAPDRPETGYGWIRPSEPILGPWWADTYEVGAFVEKPSMELATRLYTEGCLWNSFVLVGLVPTFLALIDAALPSVFDAFAAIRSDLGTAGERPALECLYSALPAADFSQRVLAQLPSRLAVVAVKDVEWDDLGTPARVMAVRDRLARSGRPVATWRPANPGCHGPGPMLDEAVHAGAAHVASAREIVEVELGVAGGEGSGRIGGAASPMRNDITGRHHP